MTSPPSNGVGRQPVFVTEMAAVTAVGDSLQSTWRALLAGQSGIAPVQRFSTHAYTSSHAAGISHLKIPPVRSAVHTLTAMLCDQLDPVPSDAALITATTKAGIDVLQRAQDNSPELGNDLLPSILAAEIAERLKLSGQMFNVSAACASSTVAISRGAALIATGRADVVLVCGLDLVTEFVFSGFSALKALSPAGCRPFDRRRDGLTLGEGAAALMLMSGARAESQKRSKLARVSGWGAANDATHMTAPARDGCGLVRAIRQALTSAGLRAGDVDAINAHGTGTVYNDMMELVAFERVFGKKTMPIYSLKGALGHTLGAAGAIEAALAVKTLQRGVVPPTIGLRDPEPRARGRVQSQPVRFEGTRILSTNSGFGGVNAAVIIEGIPQ